MGKLNYKGARGIIELSRKNKVNFLNAIKEAVSYGVYTYKAVKNIMERIERDHNKAEELINNSNVRGEDYYKEKN